jgi:hypothetical protein
MSGKKYDKGKPDYSLMLHAAELEVVKALTFGAKKYDRENWRYVEDATNRYYAAARRHLSAVRMGEDTDPETGLHHYAHAICCLYFLLELEIEKRNKEEGS